MIGPLDTESLLLYISELELDLETAQNQNEELSQTISELEVQVEDLKNRLSEIYGIARDVV